jgi:hypothetical protein
VIKAFATLSADRLELGQAINSYRLHFKARRSWLRIAEVLGRRLGRCRATLYNLMGDAERALELTKVRRAALRAQGIEPAKPRFAPILSHLAGGPEDEAVADARLAVQTAIASFKSQQVSREGKAQKPASAVLTLDEFVEKQIERMERFAQRHSEVTRRDLANAVTGRIHAWAKAEVDGAASTESATVGDHVSSVDGSTSISGASTALGGIRANRSKSAQAASRKRPPVPAATQQPTLFDQLGSGI